MQTAFIALGLVASTRAASAESSVKIYYPGDGTILIHLADATDRLAKLVDTTHKGVVRCFDAKEHIVGHVGAGELDVVGCYVAVDRRGKLLAAPATTKRWELTHLTSIKSGGLALAPVDKADALLVTISGDPGTAIGLWIDCAARSGDLRCDPVHGMAGALSWSVGFIVSKNGDVQTAKP